MQVTAEFLKAKSDKNLRALVVHNHQFKPSIRLVIDEKSKYSTESNTVFIESETAIRVESYKQGIDKSTFKIVFGESVYMESHIKTFLKDIKKNSSVTFKVVAFNSSENLNAVNFVKHTLYGYIDNKMYLLSDYTGPQNLASPVTY